MKIIDDFLVEEDERQESKRENNKQFLLVFTIM